MRRAGRILLPGLPSLVAAILWVASSAVFSLLAWTGRLPATLLQQVSPETIPANAWRWPLPWSVLTPTLSAIALFLVHLLLVRAVTRSGQGGGSLMRVAALWMAAVLAAFVASLPFAVAQVLESFPPSRAAVVLDPVQDRLSVSVYWGLLTGWLPALLASRLLGRQQRAEGSGELEPPSGLPQTRRRRRGPVVAAAALALLALVAVGLTAGSGSRAARLDAAAQEAIAEGHTVGELPDPDLTATPPASTAPDAAPPQEGWCTPDQATLLLGEPDAATGHRMLSIRVLNFSDTPCTLDGYPDVAFEDQNGSELPVMLTPGASFMTSDAGALPVELPAGGYAIARLGWDAAPTNGARVTYRLYAAMYPGLERGSWPITLDIVEGSQVAVTAWELDETGPVSEG